MARWILVVVVVCALFGGIKGQINYCSTTYCAAPKVNVGCNPPPTTGGASCAGKNPQVITMVPALITLILNEHNTRRSQFALGNLPPFAPAKRMPTISWDDELAKQAGNNARSCIYGHDACRNTPVYSLAGQNIAIEQFYGMNRTVESLIQDSIGLWWNEYKDTPQAYLDKYPNGYSGPAIGHFTQMVSDETNKIGCAMQYWLDGGKWQTYYLVCDYAVTNIIGRAVYKTGAVGSDCKTGHNTSSGLTGLCNPAEAISPVPNPA